MKTYTAGANDERTAVLARLRRSRARLFRKGAAESVLDLWDAEIAWLLKRDERYNKRPRGIGK